MSTGNSSSLPYTHLAGEPGLACLASFPKDGKDPRRKVFQNGELQRSAVLALCMTAMGTMLT